jgi:tRNA (guanine-N7-)-methyltransferase
MVRERTTCREFTNRYILPTDPELHADALQSFLAHGKPLEVDLGCGRGRFLLARASRYPDTAFIGIERVTLRLQKVDTRATSEGLTNIRLIRAEVLPALQEILPPSSVTTFYLYFPDPWPKRRHHIRRLVSPEFIKGIHRTLVPNGIMHIGTDHADYFTSIEKTWKKDSRFQEVPPYIPPDEEETDFGMLFRRQGLPTYRCSFQKPA